MLKSQKNEVLALIQASGLDPSKFEWDLWASVHTVQLRVSRLSYQGTGFYFLFDPKQTDHFAKFSPGADVHTQSVHPGSWERQLGHVKYWLSYLKREIEAPDLWAAVAQQNQFLAGSTTPTSDNTPFTPAERTRISGSLREIQAYMVSTQQLSTHQLGMLGERLTYLEEAAGRVGRKDWTVLAIGGLIGIVTAVAMAPAAAQDFINFASAALAWAFNQPTLLR